MRVIAVPLGAVMTRGASPETTPHVVRLFYCQTNDAVVVCTHCIQSAAVRYKTATLRTRAGSFAAGIRLRQSIIKRSGPRPAFSNPQVIALHIHNQEDQTLAIFIFAPLRSTAGTHRSRSATRGRGPRAWSRRETASAPFLGTADSTNLRGRPAHLYRMRRSDAHHRLPARSASDPQDPRPPRRTDRPHPSSAGRAWSGDRCIVIARGVFWASTPRSGCARLLPSAARTGPQKPRGRSAAPLAQSTEGSRASRSPAAAAIVVFNGTSSPSPEKSNPLSLDLIRIDFGPSINQELYGLSAAPPCCLH